MERVSHIKFRQSLLLLFYHSKKKSWENNFIECSKSTATAKVNILKTMI